MNIVWKNRKLEQATIYAHESKPLKVRYAGKEITVQAKAGRLYRFDRDLRPPAVIEQ